MLLVHGYPESSYMWRDILPPLADAGFHALAPDLPGYGDSDGRPAGHVGAPRRGARALPRRSTTSGRVAPRRPRLGRADRPALGLRPPGGVDALVISDTGFFSDGKWRGPGEILRTEGQGEQFVDGVDREGFAGMLGSVSTGIAPDAVDEYFKAFADEDRRRGQLELYRSGDFEKLAPYEGKLAQLGVPTLMLWGADDFAAPGRGRAPLREGDPRLRGRRARGHRALRGRRRARPLRRGARQLPQAGAPGHGTLSWLSSSAALVDGAGRVDVDGQHLPVLTRRALDLHERALAGRELRRLGRRQRRPVD